MSRCIYTVLGGELFVHLWLETRRRDEKRDSHVNAEVIARNGNMTYAKERMTSRKRYGIKLSARHDASGALFALVWEQ